MSAGRSELIFARHGRTAWNEAGRYQGRSDPPISAAGQADAEALARDLRGARVRAIVTSPSRRAVATALIVRERLGVAPITLDDRLLEIAFGTWEGLTQAEVKQRWPDQLRTWKQAPETLRFPGGETLDEARGRLFACLREPQLFSQSGHGDRGTTLVVGHGGMIRLAVLAARRAPLTAFRAVEVAPGSIHRFRLRNDGACASLSLHSTEYSQ